MALRLGHGGLLLCAAVAVSAGCVEVQRGAAVVFNLSRATNSAPGEHYELFAEVNGGAVSIARFKILDSVGDCGFTLEPAVQLVQAYDAGASREALCDVQRRLGAVDRIDLATATLVGGARVATDVDLREATRIFLTIEPDGDADPRPNAAIAGAELGDGVAPRVAVTIECNRAFCETLDPDNPRDAPLIAQLCGENLAPPRARRGIRAGVFLALPAQGDPCRDLEIGRVTVVPAVDETFL